MLLIGPWPGLQAGGRGTPDLGDCLLGIWLCVWISGCCILIPGRLLATGPRALGRALGAVPSGRALLLVALLLASKGFCRAVCQLEVHLGPGAHAGDPKLDELWAADNLTYHPVLQGAKSCGKSYYGDGCILSRQDCQLLQGHIFTITDIGGSV